jgi:serine/threonine-protein kinase HipA
LSLSLPFNLNNEPLKGPQVTSYFDNLLPDSMDIRRRVATRFQTGSVEPFDLLRAIGRDCVGAIQLLPEGAEPAGIDQVDAVEVDDAAVERPLLEVVTPGRFGAARDPDDDFRISLAGAQEKDAFLWWKDKWHKPRGATPTTHIFKLPIGLVGGRSADFSTSVDNEYMCMKLLQAYGLATARVRIETFGAQRVLVVERFDRTVNAQGTGLLRLPQEDFCQATGTSPLAKYENDGGPGLKTIFLLLQQSQSPEQDLRTFMAAQVLFWLLRAPDGHAKNFSISLLAGGTNRFCLTPMYDVMSAYPAIGPGPNQWFDQEIRLAMALLGKSRHYHMHTVQRRHFSSTARQVGYGADAQVLVQELLDKTPAVIEQVQRDLPKDFSQQVLNTVLGGLQQAAKSL